MAGNRFKFLTRMVRAMERVNSKLQGTLTRQTRVGRRFSLREMAAFIGLDEAYLSAKINSDDQLPDGEKSGREKTFSVTDMMRVRAVLASREKSLKTYLHWRKPMEPLPVITVSGQKGGTGKSLVAATFAQYLSLSYGLRVGLIDMDPQATLSLYFADHSLELFTPDVETVANFMGVDDPYQPEAIERSPVELNGFWRPTPWPGIRLIPGGPNINDGDVSLFRIGDRNPGQVYKSLKMAIERWSAAHPPRTQPEDLVAGGRFDERGYEAALSETVDVIVIDQQPAMTMMQLNGIVAADSLILPQTMKGFDLSTLTTYVNATHAFLTIIRDREPKLLIGGGRDTVLPTIVQRANAQDYKQIEDLMTLAPQDVLPVFYERSDAVAHAAEVYQSIYEFRPAKNIRRSAKLFFDNANMVNDALVERVLPHLDVRGFKEKFFEWRYDSEGGDETQDEVAA